MPVVSTNAKEMSSNPALSADTKEAFFRCLADAQRALFAAYSHVPPDVQKQIGVTVDDRKEKLFAMLQSLVVDPSRPFSTIHMADRDECWNPFLKFLARPEIQPVHFVRFMLLTGGIVKASFGDEPYVLARKFELLMNQFHDAHSCGLRDIAAAFKAVGLDETLVGHQQLKSWEGNPFNWPADSVWPYWAEHMDLLDQALQPVRDGWLDHLRRNAFSILTSFPEPPERFLERLWTFAFGLKTEREQAQDALGKGLKIVDRVLGELVSNDPERRAIAAEWLGRIGNKAAINPLMSAVQEERKVEPRNAMLLALESLEGPIDLLVNREILLSQAREGFAGGVPQDLQWFPFPALPQVRWSDTNEPIPAEIPQWWVIETFKLKNPEPGPLLRRYCAQIAEPERQALGRFVLQTWIAQEAHTRKGPVALTCKGVLAIAAACCGGDAAAAARTYLTNWPRERAGQCKALVQMLAWIDHPAASQVLLAVSARFKPITVQEEARRLSLALAQRKQWTVLQMADRAIPTAGLDEDGALHLSYGARIFTGRLNNQLDFVLADGAGKQIKSLPAARVSDDEALVREAKRLIAAAKKELKSVLQIQRDRLYEAMCIQRMWDFEEWHTHLHRHPVMRLLCQRLVWFAATDDGAQRLFHPLGDGSLIDADDNIVELNNESRIGLAHESKLAPEMSRAWQQHLADYAVEPLFPQFGIHDFKPSVTQLEGTALNSFEGHMVDAFTLRGKAGKFGYSRGPTVDGPWFNQYLKMFSTLGITAVIGFSGNEIPEENRQVALTELFFSRQEGKSLFRREIRIPLCEIPPVLLSECWNQVRQIAAGGHGFDPEWKTKTVI